MDSPKKPNVVGWATKLDLDSVISSKDHFITLFQVQGGYFLPPKSFITWEFIRDVLNGTKSLLPLSQVQSLYVPPKVSELTVAKIYAQIEHDKRITCYLPDCNRPQDKKYLFGVLSAILPDFYRTILAQVKQQRMDEEPIEEKIQITPQMQSLLQQGVPFLGPKSPVGVYLKSNRKWPAEIVRKERNLDLKKLF